MSLSSKEAAETLSDVARAERRSAQAFGYSRASPHLMIWGLVWVAGYASSDFYPQFANWLWLALILLGGIAGSIVASRQHKSDPPGKFASSNPWRFWALFFVIVVFIVSTDAIFHPTRVSQPAAFPALITGAVYAGLGLWFGMRFVVAGLLIMALTLGGYFFLHEHFLLWMAVVGGGGLILAGFWFRAV